VEVDDFGADDCMILPTSPAMEKLDSDTATVDGKCRPGFQCFL